MYAEDTKFVCWSLLKRLNYILMELKIFVMINEFLITIIY